MDGSVSSASCCLKSTLLLSYHATHINLTVPNKDVMNSFNIAIDKELIFLGSEKLRRAIKEAKLVGLQFKDRYGTSHFFLDEESGK